MSSSYGKIDEAEQARLEARRKTRKRITIIVLSSIVLVAIIVGALVGTLTSRGGGGGDSSSSSSTPQSVSDSIKAACKATLYPDSCYTSLYAMLTNSSNIDPQQLAKLSVQIAITELSKVSDQVSLLESQGKLDNMSAAALQDCVTLMDLAMDHLNDTLYSTQLTALQAADDLRTWLSAAGTCQDTCLVGLQNASQSLQTQMGQYTQNSTEFISNSLALVTTISNIASSIKMGRRLMSSSNDQEVEVGEFPVWLSAADRKLLKKSANQIKPDLVVAQDGSSKYRTISEALKAVPDKSKKRTVIYVKKGVYNEKVTVLSSKWNIMMIGDGMGVTIVTGNLNFVDGTPTFQSATVVVYGKGFMATGMEIRNTAGAVKQQAVALLSHSDQSVFFRCRMDAYQDTLYTHSLRQFYRECDILGTVDFIFGNAAVIFQNCNILARLPLLGQENTLTAQGRFDPNQNTGTSIQNCNIAAAENLKSTQTYLGRPWKNYSTTIYMESWVGGFINPAGWLPWVGNTAPNTIFYAEYNNVGPGSSTKNRVKWKGLKTSLSASQANKFTVNSFIGGGRWIYGAGVPFKAGL
ncbi:probable pectinesterase/pectinesterase inhibitor 46 [Telopea speciosissima]|uniref:probable pectinesterase/pectinesterase inhibitor 46 n=1 Tax=Telopea speciosissima TaxID=54955 RepID=UPI001CC41BC4|nr:probable pectinesterase/pectinesterase inhibitor 46 [Telopea speciosissima]